jgi:hypothetical protein
MPCLTGCTKRIVVEVPGASIEERQSAVDRVCQYPGSSRSKEQDGPLIAIHMVSDWDLAALCKHRDVHLLYFVLSACSSDSELIVGDVLYPQGMAGARNAGRSAHQYVAYVPISLERLSARAAVNYGVNVPRELESARHDGLCIAVGGANMLGMGFRSDPVKLPVGITGSSLVVLESNGTSRVN